MNTRKASPEAPAGAVDNSSVETVPEQITVNPYLHLPRVLLAGFLEDMTSFMRLHPETNGNDRAMRIRLLTAIIDNPQQAPEADPAASVPVPESALRDRIKTAERLLREAEPLVTPAGSKVNARVKHVIAGTLEWRIGEFLQGRWPRAGEQ